jgi:hypothetical protein
MSNSVSVCLEEKDRECSFELTRSHSHSRSHSFSVPGAGLEPAQPLWPQDFKSCVSTIPPSGQKLSCGLAVLQLCSCAVVQLCSCAVFLSRM